VGGVFAFIASDKDSARLGFHWGSPRAAIFARDAAAEATACRGHETHMSHIVEIRATANTAHHGIDKSQRKN
jgi:hypothetical protein